MRLLEMFECREVAVLDPCRIDTDAREVAFVIHCVSHIWFLAAGVPEISG